MRLTFAGDPLSLADTNALVAQWVMRLRVIPGCRVPDFTGGIAEACMAVESLSAEGYELCLTVIAGEWHAEFEPVFVSAGVAANVGRSEAIATAPLAICIAALGVRGIEVLFDGVA